MNKLYKLLRQKLAYKIFTTQANPVRPGSQPGQANSRSDRDHNQVRPGLSVLPVAIGSSDTSAPKSASSLLPLNVDATWSIEMIIDM